MIRWDRAFHTSRLVIKKTRCEEGRVFVSSLKWAAQRDCREFLYNEYLKY